LVSSFGNILFLSYFSNAYCEIQVGNIYTSPSATAGIPYLLSGCPTPLGAEEIETNHISPPHAAGLPRRVRPAGGDLLVPKPLRNGWGISAEVTCGNNYAQMGTFAETIVDNP
jgi:hypothetical protein